MICKSFKVQKLLLPRFIFPALCWQDGGIHRSQSSSPLRMYACAVGSLSWMPFLFLLACGFFQAFPCSFLCKQVNHLLLLLLLYQSCFCCTVDVPFFLCLCCESYLFTYLSSLQNSFLRTVNFFFEVVNFYIRSALLDASTQQMLKNVCGIQLARGLRPRKYFLSKFTYLIV